MEQVYQAIRESISHNRIVTLRADAGSEFTALEAALEARCDDSASTTGDYETQVREFWGTTDDGDEWRVHIQSWPSPVTDED